MKHTTDDTRVDKKQRHKPVKGIEKQDKTKKKTNSKSVVQLSFDGSEIKFPAIKKKNNAVDLTEYFTVLRACRGNKPCQHKNRFAAMCFYAVYKPTGQKVILKTMSDNTKSIDTETGVPSQCVIDEIKEECGIQKMGTNWCIIKGKACRNEGETEWSTTEDDLNFEFVPKSTRYIIIQDQGHRKVLSDRLKEKPNLFKKNKDLELEAMKIILFKYAFTRDNHFTNMMISDDDSAVFSIDEENFATNYKVNAEKNSCSLCDQYSKEIKKKVGTAFLNDMKKRSKELVPVLKKWKKKEFEIFEGVNDNINALIEMLD